MYRILEYAFFFAILLLLQVFLFNNLDLGVYIHPLVYVAFILLLPMELAPIWVLMLGLTMGAAADMATGTPGLNTIATLFTAYARRWAMMLMIGKEGVGDGGIPCSSRIGSGKFLRYATLVVFLHCLVFFVFEALTFRFLHLILLKIFLSTAVTTALIYFTQFLLYGTYGKKTTV